jgi:hypothetical protein
MVCKYITNNRNDGFVRIKNCNENFQVIFNLDNTLDYFSKSRNNKLG